MLSRGRSRDVSPLALARRTLSTVHPVLYDLDPGPVGASVAPSYPDSPHAHAHAHAHTHATAHPSRSTTPTTRPVASSPPTDPSLMPSRSSSDLSVSPDPSAAGPLTPPEYPYSGSDHRALDYYDSPPSPPRTLQDQMQVAYALDNMHLAKVLLLRLQGINVTDDDDPRIALVKDADFNDAFVPPGGLMLDHDIELRCREAEMREQDRRRRRAREDRLRACEHVWDNSIRSLREDKERAARRKDDKLREKRRSQMLAKEHQREAKERDKHAHRAQDPSTRYTRQLRVPTYPTQRAVLSYGALPASSSRFGLDPPVSPLSKSPPHRQHQLDASFQYPIMQPTHSPPSSVRHMSSSPKSPLRAYNEFAAQSRNVSFADVIKSMRGPLFPVAAGEEERSARGRNASQVKLFDELLRPARWDGDDSQSRIPAKDRITRRRTTDECVACSLDSVASSSSLSGSSSSKTAVSLAESARTETTVRSSPPAIHAKVSWFPFRVRTLLTVQVKEVHDVESQLDADATMAVRHSCPHSLRIVVECHPLASALPAPRSPVPAVHSTPLPPRSRPRLSSRSPSTARSTTSSSAGLVTRVTRSVSTFFDMATSFQRAYVNATMSNTGASWDDDSDDGRSRSRSSSRSRSVSVVGREGGKVRKEGYRAASVDVAVFTSASIPYASSSATASLTSSTPDSTSQAQVQLTHPLIPLYPLSPPPPTSPSTLSIPRKLPPPAQPPRSPFRLPYPPPTVTSRLRPIANPLLLRMRAAQNASSCVGGVEPEARGHVANEVREVKEKMVGVAWEGIGRSGLGWEVRVRVC